MTSLIQNNIEVKKSPVHGYGVFATKNIAVSERIEECHCILSSGVYKNPNISNYSFIFGNQWALPLGFGCIYNHSNTPNAQFYFDETNNLMIIIADKPIRKNEEIFISYGKSWFGERNMPVKKNTFNDKNYALFERETSKS